MGTDTPGTTNWHPHDQGIDVYSVVPHHGGGEHPVAPVSTQPSHTDNSALYAQAQRMHISAAEQSQHRDPLSGEMQQPGSVLAPVAEPQAERYMGGTGQGSLGAFRDPNHQMHAGNAEIMAANRTHTSVATQQDISMAPDTHVAPGEPTPSNPPMAGFIPADPYSNPDKFSRPNAFSNRLVYTGGGNAGANMAPEEKPKSGLR